MQPPASQPTAASEDDSSSTPEPSPEPKPLLELREGLPETVVDAAGLATACAALAAGSGPVAIDAERASGYRYSNRAYLIQLRREGAGTWLIDPIPFGSQLPQLAEALAGVEWILHAATQDIMCLREVGLMPTAIFDTELAGRLLGYPRVGLATLVDELLGMHLRKEHSAADWSTRPLPESWLEYAALDVEVLIELRDLQVVELEQQGKTEWAAQEFEHLLDFEPTVRAEPWRRVSGLHKLKGRRAQGAVRALWEARDELARERDLPPGRLLPDAALVAAAEALPRSTQALLSTPGFHGRGAKRYASVWTAALREVANLPEDQLPTRAPRGDGPPQARLWADQNPEAAARLVAVRDSTAALAEELGLPVENLLTPDYLRRAMWEPPSTRDPAQLNRALRAQLAEYGARPWQIEQTAGLLTAAVLGASATPIRTAD